MSEAGDSHGDSGKLGSGIAMLFEARKAALAAAVALNGSGHTPNLRLLTDRAEVFEAWLLRVEQ